MATLRYIVHEIAFDFIHHSETAAEVVDHSYAENINDYHAPFQGANPWVVSECLKQLRGIGVNPALSSFLDYGSGKGRVMIMALRAGFKSVIGVEYDARLCEIARKNIAKIKAKDSSGNWVVHNGDAADYEVPADVSVVFLYNPFGCNLVAHVMHKLQISVGAAPRKLYVVYVNPVCADTLIGLGFVQILDVVGEAKIFTIK